MPFSTHEPTSVCLTAASTGVPGLYMEVKSGVKKTLYDAPKKVLPNAKVEPVILFLSIQRTITFTTPMMSMMNKRTAK